MSIMSTSTRKVAKDERVEMVYRAFTDRTRLRILNLLQVGELCVSDIVGALQLPQAKVSHHLKYLGQAGFVEMRKDGLWCYYRLADALTPLHASLVASLDHCDVGVPELVADRKRAAVIKASGGCCPE